MNGMAKQRIGLILAVAVAAFALVATGGVAATAIIQTAIPAKAAETNTVSVDTVSGSAAQVETVAAAYRKQLEEANARIRQANAEITQLKQRVTEVQNAQATQTAQSATASEPSYRLSADDAAQLVLRAAPGTTLLGLPELVDFRGAAAYEVQLDAGTVYVDANSGEFLYAQRGHRDFEGDSEGDEQHEEEHSNGFGG